jgi:DNA-directed RNA polymerase specialized sigma24 family protein
MGWGSWLGGETMTPSLTLAALVEQLRVGNPGGPPELYTRFVVRLMALARARLDGRLRAKVDPEDVVQSALRSFFGGVADGRLVLDDPDRLWGLLALVTLRKCRKQARIYLAERRDVRREADDEADGPVALDRDPTPEEAACLNETVEQMMTRLGSPLKRRIFEMSLQGYSVPEIADALNHYERGVKRVRAEIRDLLSGGGLD